MSRPSNSALDRSGRAEFRRGQLGGPVWRCRQVCTSVRPQRCRLTSRSTGPLARIRSPRPVNVSVGRTNFNQA